MVAANIETPSLNAGITGLIKKPHWGEISGTLGDQTDLARVLEGKIEMPEGGTAGDVLRKTENGVEWDGESGAVLSVNGQTGAVQLDASDIPTVNGEQTTIAEDISALSSRIVQLEPDAETYTIGTSDWTAVSDASPYTYQATVTATHTIGNDTVCKLINDQLVLFATYGFGIASVSGQSVTIYAIGQPTASVMLEVDYYG